MEMRRKTAAAELDRGQVLIEVMLMLPIFLMLIFAVMEIGHLAFRTILLHHAAYELARIGSLTTNAKATPVCTVPIIKMNTIKSLGQKMLKGSFVTAFTEQTLIDAQEGCPHYDLVLVMEQRVPMIFPMTGIILSNTQDKRDRRLEVRMRMPIERPLFK